MTSSAASAESTTPRRPRLSVSFRSYSSSRLRSLGGGGGGGGSNSGRNSSESVSGNNGTTTTGSSSTSSLFASVVRPRSHTLSALSSGGSNGSESGQQASSTSSLPLPSTPNVLAADLTNATTGTAAAAAAAGANTSTNTGAPAEEEAAIRMTPFMDHSSTTPALYFEPIERKGKQGAVIRLGRYTDKKELAKLALAYAPVVFKSKVVSRSHAELWAENGQWFVKDIKSSSGTFLNHIRLSPANQASQAFQIKDGDLLQLGMDFRGGSEEVYKCVRMRLEINRSWQRRINNFNVSAHSQLRTLTRTPNGVEYQEHENADQQQKQSQQQQQRYHEQQQHERQLQQQQQQECSICLVSVAPCQSLFVAPCSHVWHYKCVRPIIIRNYPQFLCPNCRAVCDLEADVEVPEQPYEEPIAKNAIATKESSSSSTSSSSSSLPHVERDNLVTEDDDEDDEENILTSRMAVMTPPNEAGPYVFDSMVVEQNKQVGDSTVYPSEQAHQSTTSPTSSSSVQ
ncbi:hypothetical protein V1514DRAFT_333663 [Lipomyces japonicus]|uniref:uncharacterized protein n=1 Tax=Lipomyces japonicus TaxID=56871 RepID=UPI0034D017F9